MKFRIMKKKLGVLICFILLENAKHVQSVEFECEKQGFAVVQSDNCGIYYYCVEYVNNEFFPVKFACPQGEEFSLLNLQCVPGDNNECGELPEIPIDGPILLDDFVCPSSGRFPNVESPDCKSYYVCSSVLIPVLTKCPSTTIFSWVSMKCVMPTTFTCPNEITITTEATTITTQESPSPDGFVCITEGRFADPKSVNCQSYYFCEAQIDGNIETILSQCPSSTVFSPENQKCVVLNQYECPTTITSTEPSTTHAATTTTTSETIIPNVFKCTDIGRFPDPASTDCRTYYDCTINMDEVYEAIQNQCPSSTIFSPVDQKCLESGYQCPVDTTSKTNEPSTIDSTTSYTTDFEVTTQDYSTSETTNQSTENTSEQNTLTSSNPKPFICTSSGRFSDPESTDCKGYYLCTKNTEGFYEASSKQCPTDTIFYPESGKCVLPIAYECPTVETTTINPTENPSTIISSTTTSISTLTTPSTTVLSTDLTISTTDIITTTNEPFTSATYEPTPGELFTCTEKGRFPDPESTDCKSYYLCTEITDGFFKTTLNQCPSTTIFHPENGKCVMPSTYQCSKEETSTPSNTSDPSTIETSVSSSETSTVTTSTQVITTQVPPSNESFVCTAVGRFPDPFSTNCKSYYLCSTTVAGSYNALLSQCPSGTIFSAGQNRCVLTSQYQCPTATTTSTVGPTTLETIPPTTPISGNFICTSIGRHPDTTQPDCSKYKYCLLTATNVFLEYTFNCPTGSFFNPLEHRCSIGYNCPIVYPTVTPETTTELSLMTTPFYCISDGRFPDPTSEGCDRYIMCIKTAVGDFQNYNFKCPNGSLFSPIQAKCSTSYICV